MKSLYKYFYNYSVLLKCRELTFSIEIFFSLKRQREKMFRIFLFAILEPIFWILHFWQWIGIQRFEIKKKSQRKKLVSFFFLFEMRKFSRELALMKFFLNGFVWRSKFGKIDELTCIGAYWKMWWSCWHYQVP